MVEEVQEQFAEVIGARPSEVVHGSGGTQADNLAVKGLELGRRDGHVAVRLTAIEHDAGRDSVRWPEQLRGPRRAGRASAPKGRWTQTLRAAISQVL